MTPGPDQPPMNLDILSKVSGIEYPEQTQFVWCAKQTYQENVGKISHMLNLFAKKSQTKRKYIKQDSLLEEIGLTIKDCGTPTADMLLVKIHLNSVISMPGAKYACFDVKNFYLNTPMDQTEYVRIKIEDVPDEIIEEYNLREMVDDDGYLYVEVKKGMYGLPQAGLLAQQLLEKQLNKHGYFQSSIIPGFWKHDTRPISFTLVVNDFRVKYVGKEHADHLLTVLKQHYESEDDWTGSKYIGLTID